MHRYGLFVHSPYQLVVYFLREQLHLILSAVMASDAFFPFNDCVQLGHQAGIAAFIQPGGSVRDKDSIQYCQENKLAMVMTGLRHFRH